MSTKLSQPLPATQLQVGEVRAQLIGGAPTAWARIAYCSEDGQSMGDTTFSAWSKESWELLVKLCDQVEKDLADWMDSRPSNWKAIALRAREEEEEEDIESDGLEFMR